MCYQVVLYLLFCNILYQKINRLLIGTFAFNEYRNVAVMAMAHICTFCGVVSQSLRWPYRQVSFPKARRNAGNDTEVLLKCLLPCLIAVVEHQLSQLLTSERKVVMEPSHSTSKASCMYCGQIDRLTPNVFVLLKLCNSFCTMKKDCSQNFLWSSGKGKDRQEIVT